MGNTSWTRKRRDGIVFYFRRMEFRSRALWTLQGAAGSAWQVGGLKTRYVEICFSFDLELDKVS